MARDADRLGRDVGRRLASTPGLRYRDEQVRSLRQDLEPAGEAEGLKRGVMGGSADEPTHHALKRAEAARNRQRRVAQGQALYDRSGRYIGNDSVKD